MGKVLSVDIGTDTNPLCAPIDGRVPKIAKGCFSQWWMHSALNSTAVDRFISMTTYLQPFSKYVMGTASMLARYGDSHSPNASRTTGIGFLTGEKYSMQELQRRFGMIDALNVPELDIWFVDAVHGGVPDNWLPFLRSYLARSPVPPAAVTAPAPTVHAGRSSAATAATKKAGSARTSITTNRTAMVWMGWDRRSDALMDAEVSWFTARHNLLTASPTCHTLGANATLIEIALAKGANHTAASVWKQLRAGGVKVLPTIYNDANGMHTALLPKFMQLAATPDVFIAKAVRLAVESDLEGWNIDFEISAADQANATLVAEAGALLPPFVDRFARALHAHGKVLTLDVATADFQWWNGTALNASALDSIADMSTYKNYRDFIISLGIALLEYSPGKIGVGFGNHGNRSDTALRQRFEVIEGLGVHEIDIWFVDALPKNRLPDNWLPHIEKFLAWGQE